MLSQPAFDIPAKVIWLWRSPKFIYILVQSTFLSIRALRKIAGIIGMVATTIA